MDLQSYFISNSTINVRRMSQSSNDFQSGRIDENQT